MTKARTLASFDSSGVLTSTSTLNPANLDDTGTLPLALITGLGDFFGNGQGVPSGHYTLVDVADYQETTVYQVFQTTDMFQCTDKSLTFTTTDQANGDDIILIHGSLSAQNEVYDLNGYGIYMVHSTDPTFATYSTTLQTGRYGEYLTGSISSAYNAGGYTDYTNTTGFAKLTGLVANTQYYVRMYAMTWVPEFGQININADGYGTSSSVRHGVIAQQFMKNPPYTPPLY